MGSEMCIRDSTCRRDRQVVEIKTTHKQYSVDRCESKSGTNKSMLFGEESYYNDAIVLCFILLGSAFFASTGR